MASHDPFSKTAQRLPRRAGQAIVRLRGADGGEYSPMVNLGGSRVKHGRRPTIESQRPLTPRNPQEIALLSHLLAKAQREDEKDVPAAVVELYNNQCSDEGFSEVSTPTIRAPTST